MLKRAALTVLLVAVAALGLGCVENAMLMKVKPDGSGHVVYRLLMSEEMFGGLQMMATMSASQSGGEAAAAGLASTNLVDGIMRSLADQLGTGVTFQSGKQLANDKGWKGFEAVYQFSDVTQLKLADLDPTGQGGTASASSASLGPKYRFAFTPGEVATLELIPTETKPARASESESAALPAADLPDLPDGMDLGALGEMGKGMQGMMGGMMTGMMKSMLQGMRISMVMSVDGEVVETNARYPSDNHPNAFVLVDIPFDTILSNPEAAALMMQPAPDPRALAKMDIPGLKMEEPGKTIRVKFK